MKIGDRLWQRKPTFVTYDQTSCGVQQAETSNKGRSRQACLSLLKNWRPDRLKRATSKHRPGRPETTLTNLLYKERGRSATHGRQVKPFVRRAERRRDRFIESWLKIEPGHDKSVPTPT